MNRVQFFNWPASKKLYLIVALVLAMGMSLPLLTPRSVQASGIIQLTKDSYGGENPQIDAGQVTWQGWDGTDYEIFLYNGSSTIQLTNNDYDDYEPQIDAGQVTWYGWDGTDYEIFLYNGSSTIQLTNNDYDDSYPQIDAGQVTWEVWDGTDYEIFLYDGSSTIQLTNNDYDDYEPQIDAGQVTWYGYDGTDCEIFLYDSSNTMQLTNNDYDDYEPQIDAGQVTWYGWDDTDSEIFLYDGSSTIQLTNNDYDDSYPQIDAGQVTWEVWDGNDCEIFLYDSSSTIQLTNNDYDDYEPQIDAGQVTWEVWDGKDYEIYEYDGTSIFQLSNNIYDDYGPQIYAGQVTWEAWDGNDYEIYLCDSGGPLLVSVCHNQGVPGQTLDTVIITGTKLTGASLVGFGAGIIVNGYEVHNDTQITGSIHIDPTAALGARDVLVTTPKGIAMLDDGFTVIETLPPNLPPNLPPDPPYNLSPANGSQGVSLTPTLEATKFFWDPNECDTHSGSQWQITTTPGDYSSPIYDSGIDSSNLTSITIPANILDRSTTYYWHVRYQDNHGDNSVFSQETSFITKSKLPIIQLTFDSQNQSPSINAGQVVWAGGPISPSFDFNRLEIFLYDGVNIVQLTDNDYADYGPQIDAGQVTWEGDDDGYDAEIFLYDGTNTVQLTDNAYFDERPQIDAGQVTWVGFDGHDREIFLYDGTRTLQLTDNSWEEGDAQISNGQVVWYAFVNGTSKIFLYNGTGIVELASTSSDIYNYGLPQIDAGQVTWADYDGHDWEIYLYDGTRVINITNNDYDDYNPQIDSGQLTWTCYQGQDSEICLYDGTSIIQLTNNNDHDWEPQIDAGQVTWKGRDGNDDDNEEIYLYDGMGINRITNNSYYDYSPQINAGQLTWSSLAPSPWTQIFFAGGSPSQVATATGTGTARLSPSSGAVQDLLSVPETNLPTVGKPSLEFPHGFFEFEITSLTPGETVTLSISLPEAVPVGTQYWKYGPTPGDNNPHWYQIPMGENDGDNVVTITLVDGGLGDDDLAVNGVVVDQGGPGNPHALNTPVGSPVTVPLSCAAVTFSNVTGAGTTACTSQQGNPSGGIPSGFRVHGLFIDITTTAAYSGAVTVCIQYDPSGVQNPQNLKLFHWNAPNWDDVTTEVNTGSNTICGQVNTLSPFFVGEPMSQVQTATGTGTASFSVSSGTIENLAAVAEGSLPTEGKPSLVFPHGFFRFDITGLSNGQTVTVVMELPSNITNNAQYWKWDSTLGWHQINFSDNDGDRIIAIQLTDNGTGDSDPILGRIHDDGGPGNPPTPTPTATPTGEAGGGGGGGGGCFIATAAYGSSLDSHVDTLRSFRDQYLETNPIGSAFVSLYYKVSPPMAEFINEHPALKPIVRAGLMPAVVMSTVAVDTTPVEKIAIASSLAFVCILVFVGLRRKIIRGKF